MELKSTTWFMKVSLVLLFISGCWTVGSLMVPTRGAPKFIRPLLLGTTAVANVSFLTSLLFSVFGTTQITQNDNVRRAAIYAFTVGVIFLAVSIILFCAVAAAWPPFYGD